MPGKKNWIQAQTPKEQLEWWKCKSRSSKQDVNMKNYGKVQMKQLLSKKKDKAETTSQITKKRTLLRTKKKTHRKW